MPSAAAATLSAVPRSTRLHFRWAGTVGRCTTPGVNTTGSPEPASVFIRRPSPPSPPSAPGGERSASRSDASSRSAPRVIGRPYPEGPAIRSGGPPSVSRASRVVGSCRAWSVGKVRSSQIFPRSRPQRSIETVPGSMPMTRGTGGVYFLMARAMSAIASASRTRPFFSKRLATQRLWSLVLKLPTPNAP